MAVSLGAARVAAGRRPAARAERRAAVAGASAGRAEAQASTTRVLSATLGAVGAASLALAPGPAAAIYDSGDVISDGPDALVAAYAASRALPTLANEITSLDGLCPAPTFPCDLAVVSKKAGSRLSGPLKRTLTTLVEVYEIDPSVTEDALQNVELAQGILYQNNARVQVDFKTPVQFLELAGGNLAEAFSQVPADALEQAVARYDACDMTVAPEAPGALECRIRRAVEKDDGRETPQSLPTGS